MEWVHAGFLCLPAARFETFQEDYGQIERLKNEHINTECVVRNQVQDEKTQCN